jgi:HK97 family phage prohead protease
MSDTPDHGATRSALDRSPFPRENIIRFLSLPPDAQRTDLVLRAPAAEAEASANPNGMPTMFGHFTVFNRWTEIDSWYEGNFLERIAPGSFKKTFRELTPRVLFNHGMDFFVGDKVMGPPDVLREDDEGPYYEVPLLDTSYNRDLVPGLEAGLYGASFRFTVLREEFVEEPGVSNENPKGLPERTIKEVRCSEFGPVTFPAYADATAGVRSLTDEITIGRAARAPQRLRSVLVYLDDVERRRDNQPDPPADPPATPAPPQDRAETSSHPGHGRRNTSTTGLYGLPPKEKAWRL